MPPQRPSRDWPVRTAALDGTEWFIKQNAIDDSTMFPKEEMVTSDLIVQKAISDITDFSVTDEVLSLNFSNRDSLNIPLDKIRGIYGGEVSGDTITFYENDGDSVSLDMSSLASTVYVESATLSGSVLTLHRNDSGDISVDLTPINDSILSITPVGSSLTQYRLNRTSGNLATTFTTNNFGSPYRVSTVTLLNNVFTVKLLNGTEISKNLSAVSDKNINVNISPLSEPILVNTKYKYVFNGFFQIPSFTVKQVGFYLHTAGVSTNTNKKLVLEIKIGTAPQNTFLVEMLSGESYKFSNINLYLGIINENNVEITVLQNDFSSGDTLPSGLYFNCLYNR